jgi:hypothetical protein
MTSDYYIIALNVNMNLLINIKNAATFSMNMVKINKI